MDFGEIKTISRSICKDLNETFLVPLQSDVLRIEQTKTQVQLTTESNQTFVFPAEDCSMLPIIHSSAEELAVYISDRLLAAFTVDALHARGVTKVKVGIAEATHQLAESERSI